MPRADNTPPIKTIITEFPATSHPHGIRPGGEGGTTPALGVVINAIVDALSDFGVKHIEMPATPERVWRAIRHGARDITARDRHRIHRPVETAAPPSRQE